VKRPSPGGTILAVFWCELRALVAFGWLQVVGLLWSKQTAEGENVKTVQKFLKYKVLQALFSLLTAVTFSGT
jgi:hypothetical protein